VGRQVILRLGGEAAAVRTRVEVDVSGAGRLPFPRGEDPINRNRANYDPTVQSIHGTLAAGSLPEGASLYGDTEMVGNVWEWEEKKVLRSGGGTILMDLRDVQVGI
jgi:hypothetical protein